MEMTRIVAEFLLKRKNADVVAQENGLTFSYETKEGAEYVGWMKFFAAHLYEVGFTIAPLERPGQLIVSAMRGFGRVFFLQPVNEEGVAELVWIPGHQYIGSTAGFAQTLDVIFTDGETTVDDMIFQLSMTASTSRVMEAEEVVGLLNDPAGHA